MQAIAIRQEFADALKIAGRVVDRRGSVPVLANVALVERNGALAVKGTDLDLDVSVTLPGSPADAGFGTTINQSLLADLVKRTPASEEISIDIREESAALGFGDLAVNVQTLPLVDFPEVIIRGDIHADFTLSRADMLAMLDQVEFAISTEETRHYLNGIFMHRPEGQALRFVATDGHRLAWHDISAPEGAAPGMQGVIIPRKTCGMLRDLCKAKGIGEMFRVEVNTVKMRFSIGNVTLVSKLIDGTFPDYGRVIPSRNGIVATFDRAAMAKAIDAVSSIHSERGRAIRFNFEAGSVMLSVSNPNIGTARQSIPCELDGAPIEIGFNARYLLDILGAGDADTVTMRLADAGSPALIDQEAGGFVLMPMRV